MKDKPCYGLVCAGGGAHGAYQVGVLKYIHEHFSNGNRSPFQIFAGSSCGALNTSFYAAQSFDAHASRLWLEELWLDFHVPAYHGNILKNGFVSLYREWRRHPSERESAWAILDPKPMQEVIQKGFIRENLERSLSQQSTLGIAVAATELLSGRTCWFQEGPAASEWNLFHSIGIKDRIQPAHVTASCSVPVFLPPVKIGNRYYLDGSLSLDRPLSAAIGMGASRILNIATDIPLVKALPDYAHGFRPRLSNVVRLLLNRVGRDAAADEAAQIEMLNQPTEVFLFFPSRQIRNSWELLRAVSPQNPGGTETRGKKFSARLRRTRFMFHERFIIQLIQLGYADARLKHAELKNFFEPHLAVRKSFFFRKRSRIQN